MVEAYPGLEGRVAVITGASGGIGSATARVFARAGACVALHYYCNEQSVSRLATELAMSGRTTMSVRADLTNQQQVQSLFAMVLERWGSIDVLVNNAGDVFERTEFLAGDLTLWRRTFDLNLLAVVSCCQAALRVMVPQRRGCIINISSTAARTGGIPGETLHYGASKAALNAMTRGLALEFAPYGIRVNAVAPGLVDTPMHDRFPGHFDRQIRLIPLGRAGEPEEIGGLVAFLASDRASYVTGEIVYISGGV